MEFYESGVMGLGLPAVERVVDGGRMQRDVVGEGGRENCVELCTER